MLPDPIWPEVVYVVPRNFTGWICVDFDVKTGPPLPREGKTLVVRSRGNEIIQTSDRMPKADGWLWFDDEPLRLPLNELEFGGCPPG
jgi:hypothetical protein